MCVVPHRRFVVRHTKPLERAAPPPARPEEDAAPPVAAAEEKKEEEEEEDASAMFSLLAKGLLQARAGGRAPQMKLSGKSDAAHALRAPSSRK